MTSRDVRDLVEDQIASRWDMTNDHGVDLRMSLTTPKEITVIERDVFEGVIQDKTLEVWLVLEERPNSTNGYRIVFDESRREFALACDGFASDKHLVVVGWYGDFMSTFAGM